MAETQEEEVAIKRKFRIVLLLPNEDESEAQPQPYFLARPAPDPDHDDDELHHNAFYMREESKFAAVFEPEDIFKLNEIIDRVDSLERKDLIAVYVRYL